MYMYMYISMCVYLCGRTALHTEVIEDANEVPFRYETRTHFIEIRRWRKDRIHEVR